MNSIEYELQVQIMNRLKENETLKTQGIQIYDVIPENASYPYISIDDIAGESYGTKTFNGLDVTLTISILSNKPGKAETLKLMGVVRGSMFDYMLLRDGHRIHLQTVETIDIEEYADESAAVHPIKRGVLTFRFLVKEGRGTDETGI